MASAKGAARPDSSGEFGFTGRAFDRGFSRASCGSYVPERFDIGACITGGG